MKLNAPTPSRSLSEFALLARYRAVRAYTLALVAPLSAEDCCVQSMPDASPAKWHLAHTTWFFETFILERFEPDFRSHHPAFRMLFNSYYNGVGDKHLRSHRGHLTRPAHAEVLAYRADVDARIAVLLGSASGSHHGGSSEALLALVGLGLQHEQQHQELIVTDILHLLSMNPLQPAYLSPDSESKASHAPPLQWERFDAGIVRIGHEGNGFCFDNELPRHRQFVESFELASRLVTNDEYREFIEDGGYARPALWLSEGWEWVCTQAVRQPLYWRHDVAHGWQEFWLTGLQALNGSAPLAHVSLYEADAFARWRGARLPSEAEWEVAATAATGASNVVLHQLFDTCWQWTSSSYAPYPGYACAPGALGEYNGKFMINQYVLRGGSCATPADHPRPTYRNFFPAGARWQFSGIRLARSLPAQ
ncbi:MAG: ergothioneine biosynthesis protein EgtB [Herminiimonas sp.]|nr:ergothioneine biosynthesis protein EgtB [Herminiimonas sp.]